MDATGADGKRDNDSKTALTDLPARLIVDARKLRGAKLNGGCARLIPIQVRQSDLNAATVGWIDFRGNPDPSSRCRTKVHFEITAENRAATLVVFGFIRACRKQR